MALPERDHALVDEEEGGRALQLLWVWVCGVVLYFAWEAAAYRGLFAYVSEWEFDRLGQDLPTFNFTILTMLLAWPAFLLLGRFRDRRLRDAEEDAAVDQVEPLDEEAAARALVEQDKRHNNRLAMINARDYMHFLFAFTAALWFAALLILLWAMGLPDSTDDPKRYTPAALFAKDQHPQEGAARLEGTLHYGRISSFGRGVLFARRTALYAPLIPPEGSDGRIKYFIEFLPAERPDIHSGGIINHRDGVLIRADLPGALIRLYRYLGYRPAPNYHVLYVSPVTVRWPYFVIASQFLTGGLLFFLSAFWQRYHLRRLSRAIARQAAIESRPKEIPAYRAPRHVWWE